MHQVIYSIRRIPPADLPIVTPLDGSPRAMTDAELLNLGLVRLGADLYSCVHQEHRDPDTLAWAVHGPVLPGTVVSDGSLRERHARLPADVATQVFRAQVIRSSDPAKSVAALVTANLVAQAAAFLAATGRPAPPAMDATNPAAILGEARRLLGVKGSAVDRLLVPMATVAASDVVEGDRIMPHQWHGESAR